MYLVRNIIDKPYDLYSLQNVIYDLQVRWYNLVTFYTNSTII